MVSLRVYTSQPVPGPGILEFFSNNKAQSPQINGYSLRPYRVMNGLDRWWIIHWLPQSSYLFRCSSPHRHDKSMVRGEKSLFVGWVGFLDGIQRGSQWTQSPQPYGADESYHAAKAAPQRTSPSSPPPVTPSSSTPWEASSRTMLVTSTVRPLSSLTPIRKPSCLTGSQAPPPLRPAHNPALVIREEI